MRGGWWPLVFLSLVLLLGLGLGGCPGSQKHDFYEEANRFWERKLYGLAAQNYEQFAFLQPQEPRAAESLYKAGFIYAYYLLDPPRSIQLFHRLTVLYPGTDQARRAHQALADIYENQLKQYSQAITHYDKAIALDRGSGKDLSEYLYRKGRCQFRLGDWDQALETYERTVREFPDGSFAPSAAYHVGYIYFLKKSYETAEARFRQFVDKYPMSEWTFDALYHLAECFEEQDRPDEAKDVYRRIRERFPGRLRGEEGE